MKLPEAVKRKSPSEASQEAKGHLQLPDQPSREARTNKRGEKRFGCDGEEELEAGPEATADLEVYRLSLLSRQVLA